MAETKAIRIGIEEYKGLMYLAVKDKRSIIQQANWLIAEELKRRAPVVGVIRDGKVEIKQ